MLRANGIEAAFAPRLTVSATASSEGLTVSEPESPPYFDGISG